MEEGSMRVDANVSVRRSADAPFGTRCEIKNLNSVRSLGRAIEYEADRQIALLEAGEVVVQQTRHWDEDAGRTQTLRSKEDAYDYRYFLEPDLVPLVPDAEWIRAVADTMEPMPAVRRARLVELLGEGSGATGAQVDQVATVVDLGLDPLVVAAAAAGVSPSLALARTANEAANDVEAARRLDVESYVALLSMEAEGSLTATQAKAVLAEMLAHGGQPAAIAAARGFEALSEDSLAAAVADVVSSFPEEWARFCDGDPKIGGMLVGKVMKATQGKADGKAVQAELARLRG
jgi:aspartyl-tRNA(Asn)/glutamyl-tRNA(Gln) amidotransferase subunit B